MKYFYPIYLSYISIMFFLFLAKVSFEFLIIEVWISDVLTHSKKINPFQRFSPKKIQVSFFSSSFLSQFYFFKSVIDKLIFSYTKNMLLASTHTRAPLSMIVLFDFL